MTYAEKLRDPRWQKVRLEVLQRTGFTCSACGAADKTLHVHHGFYSRSYEPWEYPIDTLHCLCEDCHDEMESLKHDCHIELARLSMEQLREVFSVIAKFREKVHPNPEPHRKVDYGHFEPYQPQRFDQKF